MSTQILAPHPLVKHVVKLQKDKKYRHENNKVIVEGYKMIKELQTPPCRLFSIKEEEIKAQEPHIVSVEVLKKMSSTKNPEGILAEVDLPEKKLPEALTHLIALEGVNDPGNLGTLLRSALAFGFQGVFFLPSCCDPFNDKALRAAKGATFKLPMTSGTHEELEKLMQKHKLQPLLADIEGENLSSFENVLRPLLILSSEALGPSSTLEKMAKKIHIPQSKDSESLNVAVAGAILMHALKGAI